MKTMKKAIALLLCVVLCLGLGIPALAYNDDVTVSATLDQAALDFDADNSRTVTLTVKLSKEVQLFSVELTADVPAGLTLSGISSDINLKARNYSLDTGNVSWFDENIPVTNLLILTVTVPAGTAPGDYNIGVKDIALGTDGENSNKNWMEDGSAYATLKINGDVGSSGAKLDKTEASIGVGGSIKLVPSLLPDNTTATITNVSWASSNDTIATVDNTGKVTGEANGGPVNITATVTTSDSKTYTAVCKVTVVQSPYTVSVKRDGSGSVHAGDEITMVVTVSGESFSGLEATVTYDKNLFTFKSYDSDITFNTIDTSTAGSIRLQVLYTNAQEFPSATTVVTLKFTANNPTNNSDVGTFGFSYAKACNADNAESVGPSVTDGDTVTVVKQYTVKFMKDSSTQISSIKVDADSTLAASNVSVPTVTPDTYYTFKNWKDEKNATYSAENIATLKITEDKIFTAVFEAQSFTVKLPNTGELSGATTATYKEDYTVTYTGTYDPTNYVYTVTYSVDGGTAVAATDNKDGTFTITGGSITGALTVYFEKKLNASVEVHEDYVTGYTLITIAGNASKAYSYDGNPMYYISDKEYAWLVKGNVSETTAAGKIGEANAAAGTITRSNDVNGDGIVDIADAVIVNSVANVKYDVATKMELYLKANLVSSDYVVDFEDVNAILTDGTYVK